MEWHKLKIGNPTFQVNTRSVSPSELPKQFTYIDIEAVQNGKITNPKIITRETAPSRARRIVKEGDVLIASVRPYLRSFALVTEKYSDCVVSTGFFVIEKSNFIESRYLLHYALSDDFIYQTNQLTQGAQYPALNRELFNQIKIPLPFTNGKPDLAEQKRIADKLDKVSAEIGRGQAKALETSERVVDLKSSLLLKVYSKTTGEPTKLEEVLEYEQPTKYIVQSTDYDNSHKTPVLTAGKSFILGYTNEEDGIFPREKLPVIIFDDFTTASKLVDFPFKVKSSAMKILHPNKTKADVVFLYYAMQNINFPVRRHKRHWISEYSKIEMPLPPISQQRKIVEELNNAFSASEKLGTLFAQQNTSFATLFSSVLHEAFQPQTVTASAPAAQPVIAAKPFDIQLAVANILQRFERGEMVIAKMLYLGQEIYDVPLGIQFKPQNFGPYNAAVKKSVTAGLAPRNRFFAKKKSGNNHVLSLGTNANKLLKYSNSRVARKTNVFLDDMMPLLSKSDSASIERLATICKIIEDNQTRDEAVIREKLQEWKPDRFTNNNISKTLAFILQKGWDKKLIK